MVPFADILNQHLSRVFNGLNVGEASSLDHRGKMPLPQKTDLQREPASYKQGTAR
jgi:hypothetical protein